MRTFDFFADIHDFKEVAPGIDSSLSLKGMQASHERSKQKLILVLTKTIYDQLKDAFLGAPTAEEAIAIEYIQGAHGNNISYFQVISKVISKKKEAVSYFKYELQKVEETYLDNFAVYMDLLLDYLDATEASFEGWTDTDTYKKRQELILKTAAEFNEVFPTGGSAYFFSLMVPLQSMVIELDILPRVAIADIPTELEKTVKYFVAYKTMAKAALLVDYADLPKSMRQKLYIEEGKKKGQEMESTSERYSNQFDMEAKVYLQKIDMELNKPADDVTEIYPDYSGINEEDDQTYVIA